MLSLALLLIMGLSACGRDPEPDSHRTADTGSKASPKPKKLALPPAYGSAKPESKHRVDLSSEVSERAPGPIGPVVAGGRCPPEMVLVLGSYCVDRYEVTLVDAKAYRPLSPHYPPSKRYTTQLFERWRTKARTSGRALGRNLAVPEPPSFQLTEDFSPLAQSARGVLPAGYLTRHLSERACSNAGKRLCNHSEWVTACKGEQNRRFPYGEVYQDGVCNVHRKHHPARLLHGDASRNHLDPRLGLTQDDDGPLLRQTGETPRCSSRWGGDAIYDMVGNLDEWIDDPGGVFVGGFYSRGTRDGCEASIDVHSPGYLDYSLGTRCCKDAN